MISTEEYQERESNWFKTIFPEEITQFSKRVQKDLKTIPFLKMDDLDSRYIFGNVGSGKTILSIFMLLNYRRISYINKYFKPTDAFVSIPELLLNFREIYNRLTNNQSELELFKKYTDVDFLVLDDFGVEKTSEWSLQLLYLIVNRRYEDDKLTIFTSNYALEQLVEKLGSDKIPSRIQQMCKITKTDDVNYRENV